MHVSTFLIKHASAISMILGNDVLVATILNILKSVFFLNDSIDMNYFQFKFQVNPLIIQRLVIMPNSVNFGNNIIAAAILNIQKSVWTWIKGF